MENPVDLHQQQNADDVVLNQLEEYNKQLDIEFKPTVEECKDIINQAVDSQGETPKHFEC